MLSVAGDTLPVIVKQKRLPLLETAAFNSSNYILVIRFSRYRAVYGYGRAHFSHRGTGSR